MKTCQINIELLRIISMVFAFFASSAFAGLLAHSWEGAALYGLGMKWISDNMPAPFVFAMIYIFIFLL